MNLPEYTGKKVAILGYGLEGESAYEYFNSLGADITILDENENPSRPIPKRAKAILGEHALDELTQYDVISRTPPFSPHKIPEGPEVTSLTKEFFRYCPAPIIGVTGTKGKGTTSSLITEILRAAGFTVHLVGNIGVPALSVLRDIEPNHIVVSELSSFQLWDMKQSPEVAVMLMISEDHLDVHESIEDYIQAKSNIAAYQQASQVVFAHPTNTYTAQAIKRASGLIKHYLTPEAAYIVDGDIQIDDTNICAVGEVGLLGQHNLENITAAISAAWVYTQDVPAIRSAVTSFKGLEHRLEFVAEKNGVRFYNDSYSATPAATIAAIRSFTEPTILIFGGSEKHSPYEEVAKCIKDSSVEKVLLIGQTAQRIEATFKAAGVDKYEILADVGMKEVVVYATSLARPGSVVLLSPGNASFDMFKNFKDRGEQFKREVGSL